MVTFRDIKAALRSLKATYPHTDIIKNARNVRITRVKVEELEDEDGDVYKRIDCIGRRKRVKGKESGLPRQVILHVYGSGRDAGIQCACSCEWFLYFCEYALNNHGALPYDESDMRANGSPDETNAGLESYACKHIVAALLQDVHKAKPTKSRRKGSRRRTASKEVPETKVKRKVRRIV